MNWHSLTIPHINNTVRSVFASHDGTLLRLALGTVFFWFGSLKILGESSVLGIIQAAYPFLANPPFLQMLGVGELILGASLIAGWHVRLFATLTALHLTGTLLVPFLAPSAAFNPGFPILTLEGEFVVKNLVLISVSVFLAQKNEDLAAVLSTHARTFENQSLLPPVVGPRNPSRKRIIPMAPAGPAAVRFTFTKSKTATTENALGREIQVRPMSRHGFWTM